MSNTALANASPLRRVSTTTKMVLAIFLAEPDSDHWGLEIANSAGLKSGTLYPILSRLEEHGWLVSQWEEADPSTSGRPRRRYYRLTTGGAKLAAKAIDRFPRSHARWTPEFAA